MLYNVRNVYVNNIDHIFEQCCVRVCVCVCVCVMQGVHTGCVQDDFCSD